MNKLKHSSFFIVTILSLLLLTSCGAIVKSKANKYLTEEKGAIPPEFGKENTTVLFVTHHRSYNKYLKKNVKKIFKGDYEFIREGEYGLEKYDDKNKYRFVFDYNYISYDYTNQSLETKYGKVKKFNILDRKTDKRFVSKMTSSYWSKLQKVYLKKLNEKLITEQN